jgi:hypothetical protein
MIYTLYRVCPFVKPYFFIKPPLGEYLHRAKAVVSCKTKSHRAESIAPAYGKQLGLRRVNIATDLYRKA